MQLGILVLRRSMLALKRDTINTPSRQVLLENKSFYEILMSCLRLELYEEISIVAFSFSSDYMETFVAHTVSDPVVAHIYSLGFA